ncbi:UNVERIFIED_CONTAM: hypothetical protein Sradi_3254600 [Sesamum radiatum]|uniref:CCHC-type domain-containing protein n=1 Tax=Sesamum radiatum TaxID=300843 RepID=A0AAW2QZZ8_SESRA
MLLLHVRGVVDTMTHHGSILMDVVVVMAVVGVGVEIIVEMVIIYGLIPIFRRTTGTRQRINKKKTTNGDLCYRCGMSGHWSRTCRTAQHLVKLYQASVKAKGKEVETNFVEVRILDNTHIDASDFFQSNENDDKDLPELPLQFGDITEDFNMLVD